MAFTDIAVAAASRNGVNVVIHSLQKAMIGNDDYISATGLQFRNLTTQIGILIINASTVDLTVKFPTSYQLDGLDLADREEIIPAGTAQIFGRWTSNYHQTNYEDSDNMEPQHTNYIQAQFKVAAADYGDIANDEVSVLAVSIP